MKKKILFLLFIVLLTEGNIFPSAEQIGTTANNFLKILVPAKPSGLGETYIALANDIDSIEYNPAGLSKSLSSEISLTHIEWFQQVEYENIEYSMIFPFGTIAATINWLHMDSLTKTIANPTTLYTSLYTFSPYSVYGILTYSKQFFDDLFLGANLKILNYTIDNQNATGSTFSFLFDFGLIYDLPFLNGLSAGLVFNDIGPQETFVSQAFSQPINMKIGLGYSANNFTLEGNVQAASDNNLNYSFGASYTAFNVLAFRLGYKLGTIQQPTFGAGLILNSLLIDYAFVPYNADLGLTNRITLTYQFGTPPFNIAANPAVFSPNGDKYKDFTFIVPDIASPAKVKQIILNISDSVGVAIKSLVFKDASQRLYWNGYNSLGKVVPDGVYNIKAQAIYKNGTKSDSNEISVEVDNTPPKVSIDAEPKILKPNQIGAIVVPVSFKPTATDLHNIGSWQLIIGDDKGKVVKRFSGAGDPPSPVVWDGTNDKGAYIDPGKVYTYTFYAADTVGNWAHTVPQYVHVLLREIVITLSADTLFDTGKADVKISVYQDIKKIADQINTHKNASVIVEGHTDNMPIKRSIYPNNLALSQARAEAVVKFFVDLFGMQENMFTAIGKGDTMPVASNDTDEGRQKNRRVTIRIKASEWK